MVVSSQGSNPSFRQQDAAVNVQVNLQASTSTSTKRVSIIMSYIAAAKFRTSALLE